MIERLMYWVIVCGGLTLSGGVLAQEVELEPEQIPVANETHDEQLAPNTVYVEGLGAALAYSGNYERLVIPNLAVRLGFAYLSFAASASDGESSVSSKSRFLLFPITASYIGLRRGKHALELGGGATLLYTSAEASGLGISASGSGMTGFITVLAGYRIHPLGTGFNFRVGVMGIAGPGLGFSSADPEQWGMIPWGYLSLGASF